MSAPWRVVPVVVRVRVTVGEGGDVDPGGLPVGAAGTDGGVDLVGVDVHVQQPAARDDHDRVAELLQRLAQPGRHLVGGLEQVLHLVGVGQAAGLAADHLAEGAAHRRGRHGLEAAALDVGEDAVEDDLEAPCPRVDDPGVAVLLEDVAAGGDGLADRLDQQGHGLLEVHVGGQVGGRPRRRVHGRQDRPGHRFGDRLVGQVPCAPQHLLQAVHAQRPLGQVLDQRPDELRQDDPGVARCPAQRTARRGAGHVGVVGVAVEPVDRLHRRMHRGVQVGPGVAVRHGEDVEVVDLLARDGQRRQDGPQQAGHVGGHEVASRCRHLPLPPGPFGPRRRRVEVETIDGGPGVDHAAYS